jgi:hypothetical protein
MPGLPVRLLSSKALAPKPARWTRALRRVVIRRMGHERGCSGWPPFLTAPLVFSLAAAVAENTPSGGRGRARAVILRLRPLQPNLQPYINSHRNPNGRHLSLEAASGPGLI